MSGLALVAGMGNIFLGDDGFGAEVARRLYGRRLPEGVLVADFGLRGFDLACAFLDGYETVILVDATQRGGPPGTIYVIEPDRDDPDLNTAPEIDGHAMTPAAVFRLVKAMGGCLPKVIVVGCEPESLGGEEGAIGLSDVVQAAVMPAVHCIEELLSTAKGAN
jgi:hydrogenase maturation protease